MPKSYLIERGKVIDLDDHAAVAAARRQREMAPPAPFGALIQWAPQMQAAAAKRATATSEAKRAAARAVSTDNMRRRCGLPTLNSKPLTLGQRSMLKVVARSGTPAARAAARASLDKGTC